MQRDRQDRARRWAARLLAATLIAGTGCGASLNQAQQQQAIDDLTDRVRTHLEQLPPPNNPPTPEAEDVAEDYGIATTLGTWDVPEVDSYQDRFTPEPNDEPPAPGEPR